MQKFSFIRHGEKMGVGEERSAIEVSGLTSDQQARWKNICERLHVEDPEVTYQSVEKMESLAKEIFSSLPDRALVVFSTTNYPRTRFTAEYVLETLEDLAREDNKKHIYTEVIGESTTDTGVRTVGTSGLAKEAPGMLPLMQQIARQDQADDDGVAQYLSSTGGGKGHAKEMELFFAAVNQDLASENSLLKKRAGELRAEVEQLKEDVQTNDELRLNRHFGLLKQSVNLFHRLFLFPWF
ncbi:MAG: hypothetical protein V1716_05485 [Candidatus Uhrbacteria bacterium]